MLRFKHFININEELSPEEKEEVAKWPKRTEHATKATDHYFGKGVEDKYTQLKDTQNKSEIHHAIERHLGKQITQDEYKAGQTTDEHGRPAKIGKLLNKSKAPKELTNGFANDPTRQGKKFSGLTVRTTRSAEGVAGQTSHNQSWEQQSCKNFNTGVNRSYLKPEVQHGTVVHYLHDENGKEIARSTAQPYKNDAGHIMYKADSYYGIDHQGFKDHVEQANKELSGHHKGGSILYHKNEHVYNNDSIKQEIHPDASGTELTKEYNDHKKHDDLGYESRLLKKGILNHKNVPSSLLDHLQKTGDSQDRIYVASSTKANKKHLDNAINDLNFGVRLAASQNKNLQHDHITKLIHDRDSSIREEITKHPRLSPEHINDILKTNKGNDRKDVDIRKAAISNKNANAENIHTALDDIHPDVRIAAISNTNASKEHFERGLNDTHPHVRNAAASNPNSPVKNNKKSLHDLINARMRMRM